MYYPLLFVQVLLVVFQVICLGVNTLISIRSENLGRPFRCVCVPIENILLSKPLRTFCLALRSLIAYSKFSVFFSFLSGFFGFVDSLSCINLIFLDLLLLQRHHLVQ